MSVQISVRNRLSEGAWIYAAAAAAYVVAGVEVGRGSRTPLLAGAGALAVVVVVLRPRLALVMGLAAMALPYTWGPQVPKLGFGSGILVGLLLVLACLPALTRFRPSALDIAVVAFAISPAAIAAFQGQPFHIAYWIAPGILLPYFGFRLLFESTDAHRVFAPAVIAIGLVVSVIGIWEGLSGHNPIVSPGAITYDSSGNFVTTWNVPEYRDGHLRALSTFGHPIAFGMFLLIPLAFALARGGRWNMVVVAIILTAEVLTYSRGSWFGAVLVVILLARRGRGRIIAVGSLLVLAAAFVGPVHHLLAQSDSASTEAGATTYYRLGLLGKAFHEISLFGHPFTNLQNAIPNYPDVTSLLAGTILETGVVGLLELVLIAALAVAAFVQARRQADVDYFAATAALIAQLAGLFSVALITNYQFFFWALVAYVATRHQTAPSQRRVAAEIAGGQVLGPPSLVPVAHPLHSSSA